MRGQPTPVEIDFVLDDHLARLVQFCLLLSCLSRIFVLKLLLTALRVLSFGPVRRADVVAQVARRNCADTCVPSERTIAISGQ